MTESVPPGLRIVDPFGPEPETKLEREYPPVAHLQQLVGERRPPYCDCPRTVRLNGWVKVWHRPDCPEVLGEPLESIL